MVLGGGGARGFAHAGVLRALEVEGYCPSGVVGVSMGAVVAAVYAHRSDWYEALLAMDLSDFPGPVEAAGSASAPSRHFGGLRRILSYLRILHQMAGGWGPGGHARRTGLAELRRILGDAPLDGGRIAVAVSATDLRTGDRRIIRSGRAVEAVYASAALAGVLPPLERPPHLLADGAYADLAPVDVARELTPGPVIAVDPGQPTDPGDIENGLQAIMRAMEICHRRHADLRFEEAELVLRPTFRRGIDTLEFSARRECMAAGTRALRANRAAVGDLLGPP